MSNVEALRDAGVVEAGDQDLDQAHHDAINSLTDEEVQALKTLHSKLSHINQATGKTPSGSGWLV